KNGKQHDLPVQTDFVDAWQSFWQSADANPNRELCNDQAERAPYHTYRETFDHSLTQQCPGSCPQGKTHRNLSPAADSANQKQPCKVRASNQQHNCGCDK